MFYIFTGDGKGKTTAALGMALRAYGNNKKVGFVQFMKALPSGERQALAELDKKRFLLRNFGRPIFFKKGKHNEEDVAEARRALDYAKKIQNQVDVLVLDEINIVLYFEILSVTEVVGFVKGCYTKLDLVATGRRSPKELIELADLVTEMKEIKHQYNEGKIAKLGLEY